MESSENISIDTHDVVGAIVGVILGAIVGVILGDNDGDREGAAEGIRVGAGVKGLGPRPMIDNMKAQTFPKKPKKTMLDDGSLAQ